MDEELIQEVASTWITDLHAFARQLMVDFYGSEDVDELADLGRYIVEQTVLEMRRRAREQGSKSYNS